MARGIDTAAHEGALASGTCAVVAGGIDYIYPPENAKLYDRLKAEVRNYPPEMPVGLVPQARHFPRRNRIISGLSRGVIVVEAAEGSGSLITANYALEQSREVFAIPGSPLDPAREGYEPADPRGRDAHRDSGRRACGSFANHRARLWRAGPRTLSNWLEPATRIATTSRQIARRSPRSVAGREVDELIRQIECAPATLQTLLLELELTPAASRGIQEIA